ncbi:GtrA family protein [Armatimonas sp.]|uniref:GtrA family protein n=1 Tax=Armatimonas sp. TaxID=1872638 RepID=UPI003750DB73
MLSLLQRPGVRQLIKFCLVGLSSFIIDAGLLYWLHFNVGLSVAIAGTLSFLCAVTNGYFWNSRWTFQDRQRDAKKQYPKFLATNVVGWGLNLTIMTSVIVLAMRLGVMHTHRETSEILQIIATGQGKSEFSPFVLLGAKVVATVIVVAWNFTAARLWTFKKTSTDGVDSE